MVFHLNTFSILSIPLGALFKHTNGSASIFNIIGRKSARVCLSLELDGTNRRKRAMFYRIVGPYRRTNLINKL